ncbi:uncharacterized protein LOC123885966 [Trifolium pratense]|uniref:Uncharacterized protein n=1 Tax=Trifolium pratense TaxID=57577 RepID=A0ACB0IXQ5_TRIPR|nr:uncharacterized protein LOC123885966 [Trifolium pratense]CAJ2637409.1 unnamed protein product [Trifolium pratense]
MCSALNWGPKPFKVNNCWLEHPGCKSFIAKTWEKLNIKGKKAYVIKEKFKRIKEELRVWNREVFGILNLNIENTVKELNETEALTDFDGKSQKKWVREGDSNSRFFHARIKSRRRRNHLEVLRRGEEWIQGVENMKMEAKNYFERNFIEDWHNRPFVHGIDFNELTAEDNDFLPKPFVEDDVREVVWNCDGN